MRSISVILVPVVVVLCVITQAAHAAQSLSLAEAIALAQRHRSEHAQAEIDVKLARLGLLQAALQRVQLTVETRYTNRYSRLFVPGTMCGPSRSRCSVDTHTNALEGSTTLTVPIWTGWTIESNWRRARKLEEAAHAQKGATARQLILEATRAYWTVRQIELLLEVNHKAGNRSNELVAITKARANAGIVPIVDYTRSQARSLRQAADITALTGQVEQARAELAAALQVDGDLVLTDDPPDQPPRLPSLDSLIADAGRSRPDLVVARAQSEAQRFAVRSTWGALWPQINLVGTADAYSDLPSSPPLTIAAGLAVEWKIFDSLSIYVAGRQAELQRDRLLNGEARLQHLVVAEVRSAHAGLKAAMERRDSLKKAMDAAHTGVEVIRRRYQAGTALLIELLQAQDELQDVELALVSNAIDIAQAQGELSAAVGKP